MCSLCVCGWRTMQLQTALSEEMHTSSVSHTPLFLSFSLPTHSSLLVSIHTEHCVVCGNNSRIMRSSTHTPHITHHTHPPLHHTQIVLPFLLFQKTHTHSSAIFQKTHTRDKRIITKCSRWKEDVQEISYYVPATKDRKHFLVKISYTSR